MSACVQWGTKSLLKVILIVRCQPVICLISFQFLTEHSYPGTLSSKTLQSPSTKEFVKMFEFIYRQLDPTFEMPDSKVEEEVPALLRALRWNILVLSTVYMIIYITQDFCLHICTIQDMKYFPLEKHCSSFLWFQVSICSLEEFNVFSWSSPYLASGSGCSHVADW